MKTEGQRFVLIRHSGRRNRNLYDRRLAELSNFQRQAEHYERAAQDTFATRPPNWKLLVEECRFRAAEARASAYRHLKHYRL